MLAAQSIRAGDADLIVAGGMESMSRAPFLLQGIRQGYKYGNQTTVDALIHDGLWCAVENWAMGEAAEHIASKCAVSRADQDRFSAQSHQRRGRVGQRRRSRMKWCPSHSPARNRFHPWRKTRGFAPIPRPKDWRN